MYYINIHNNVIYTAAVISAGYMVKIDKYQGNLPHFVFVGLQTPFKVAKVGVLCSIAAAER